MEPGSRGAESGGGCGSGYCGDGERGNGSQWYGWGCMGRCGSNGGNDDTVVSRAMGVPGNGLGSTLSITYEEYNIYVLIRTLS